MATNEKPGLSHQRIPPRKSGWKISNKPAEAKRATVRRKKKNVSQLSQTVKPTIQEYSYINHHQS
jgi:hypothetical protein